MMQTQNPEAHARLVDPVALPGLGTMVVYHMRPNEMRAGRTAVPGMVMKVDADNMRLDLLLFYDHMDQMLVQSVPPRIGTDRGWELPEGSTAELGREVKAMREEMAALKDENPLGALDAFKEEMAALLLGDHGKPDVPLEDRMLAICERLDRIESAPKAAMAAKAKAKRK